MSDASVSQVSGAADLWRRIPAGVKGGAVLAALGFLVHFTSATITTVNGVRACSASDLGSAALGVLAAVAALSGLRQSGLHPARRLPAAWLWPLVLLVVAVGAWHVSRGLVFTEHLCRI